MSILGPILFLLFINDLPNCITKCQCNLFADDSVIYTQNSSIQAAQYELQNDIDNVFNWFQKNKLHVNPTKSQCMISSTRHNVNNPSITIDGTELDITNKVKYLGMYITNKLSWDVHISQICQKLGRGIQILQRLKCIISADHLIVVYTTLIQPHIDYCITVWGYAPKCQINRVQRLQNRIFRIITGDFSRDSSPSDKLKRFKVLNVIQR